MTSQTNKPSFLSILDSLRALAAGLASKCDDEGFSLIHRLEIERARGGLDALASLYEGMSRSTWARASVDMVEAMDVLRLTLRDVTITLGGESASESALVPVDMAMDTKPQRGVRS